ncbi:twin-arginine translocation signal domain-containing protein [Caenimonas koreensis]|uniref:twin-arginine translocation signal domain-containing protein n=1 Tax=Caenimonas koreensis TaxID=367474 RepID=UPI00378385F2
MPLSRRHLLQASAAAALAGGATHPAAAQQDPPMDPVPALPTTPTPGKPGDFNFLAGEWKIHHLRKPPGKDWDRFTGEATCYTILGGVGSVEELRIPARNFSGMGLRLLDLKRHVWTDFWVNGQSGVLEPPGQDGSFEQGVGIFTSSYDENGVKMLSAGIWDQITPHSCRWRQAVTADGGRTWTHDWIMHWQRA